MYVIGRIEEKELLEECLKSRYPEFLAVYGRRRIGKTYLIREFFNNQFSFYSTGLADAGKPTQLKEFHRALREHGDTETAVPRDWFEAFSRLRTLLMSGRTERDYGSGKRVVFLDEVPWMDTPKSDFKSALEWFWNSFGSTQEDLLFIICGSATSWIIDNVFHNTGGLYNRVTRRMHLKPFTLKECEDFFHAQGFVVTRRQIVESYMVFGGVPFYLRLLSQRYSIHQDIERLLFTRDGQLREEYRFLYGSLFKNSDSYIRVVKALSTRSRGMTREEIALQSGIGSGGQLTKILSELEACDFIRKYQDFTKASSGCIYQLVDAFSLFYFSFLDSGKVSSWLDYLNTPGYHAWSGIAFERVCLMHTAQIKEALKIAGISSAEFAWKSKKTSHGAQIDLLIDRKDDIIDLCEMKYTSGPFSVSPSVEEELLRKRDVFRNETGTEKALHFVLISANGFAENQNTGVVQFKLTKDDLFREI